VVTEALLPIPAPDAVEALFLLRLVDGWLEGEKLRDVERFGGGRS
jgi:hypothetical protein